MRKIFCRCSALLAFSSLFGLDHAIVGIYAVDCATENAVIEENCELSLIPASCLKIVTTAAALQILGKDTRFETKLEIDGDVEDGILHGNLIIRGGGDPCLGSDRIFGSLSWRGQIAVWADAVQALAIEKIEGCVIGDASKWERALAAPSWSWEDLGNYYGAGASALSFHENCYSLVFEPGKEVGGEAQILRTEPPLPSLVFQNEVKTGPKRSGDCACIYGSEFSFLQCIRGTVPAEAGEFAIKGAIPDPAAVAVDLLVQELKERGIEINGGDLTGKKRIVIHKTFSPTVREIVHWTNQKSINLYAEHLLKKMGEVLYGKGSTEAGTRAVVHFWQSQGIDLGGFQMVDGSGLSRKNLITPKQMVQMLRKIKASEDFALFSDSLPKIKESIHAKSGSMSLVKGLAGYAGEIAFAAIVNQCLDQRAMKEAIDEVIQTLEQK